MTEHGLALAFASAVLALFSLVATAQNDGRPADPSSDTAKAPPAKAPVRTPGHATGRPGGVVATSTRTLPAETQSVRSPGNGSPTLEQVVLNAMEHPVLERVNFYRMLAGLPPVATEPRLLQVAQSHSSYLDSINEISHYETDKTNPYYMGHSPFDRIDAVKYDYAHAGEVIARQPSAHPAAAVDALMTAIYHRFIILSSDVTQAGPGAVLKAHQGTEELSVTVDFGTETPPPLPDPSDLTLYPIDGHQGVPLDFDPQEEFPSPMPGHTLVAYPVSVQVDSRHTLVVETFEIYAVTSDGRGPRLDAKLLAHSVDEETPDHAAALIALAPFAPSTTYEVVFSGSVNGVNVSRTWRFTTAANVPVGMRFASPSVAPGGTQTVMLDGIDSEKGRYYTCYKPARLVASLKHETETEMTMTTSSECQLESGCQVTVMTTYHSDCSKPFATGTFTIAR
jgi:uncharacterized protein YkwD